MQALIQQRCFNHKQREAAAKCMECGRFFCRECVTEHEDRLLCAACLGEETGESRLKKIRFAGFWQVVQLASGAFVTWIFFYYLGRMLLALPTSFHDGTLWKTGLF